MSKHSKRKSKPPIWVSQNYLTSSKTIQRLLNRTSLNKNDKVIEIGPGKGHITSLLLKRCKEVVAVELDEKLYCKLNSKFNNKDNLRLYHRDFLKWQLPNKNEYKVFANIPFSITTDILRKLTECINSPIDAWLVLEKGAAKRFMGKPHDSLRSLMIKPVFDLKIDYYFVKEDFHPKPKVDIVMLHLKRKAKPDILRNQWKAYRYFIDKGLKHNGNALKGLFTKKQLSKATRLAGLQNDLVPAEVLYIQWLCLFRCYWKYVLCKR